MTLDRQPAAVAERRLRARAIQMIRPMRTRAARTIHSQMSDELDPLAAAGEPLDWAAGAGAVALWVADGWAVGVAGTLALVLGTMLTLGETLALVLGTMLALGGALALVLGTMPAPTLGEKLMLRLGATPETTPPLPPHPVTEHAAKLIAAARSRPPAKRRMPDPSAMKSNLSQDVV
jgi:hypothetical protein